MQDVDVIVPAISDVIDAPMLRKRAPKLKLIANFGLDLTISTLQQPYKGAFVSNTPGVVTEDTADMTVALMLAVTRRIPEGLSVMQSGHWDGWAPTAFMTG